MIIHEMRTPPYTVDLYALPVKTSAIIYQNFPLALVYVLLNGLFLPRSQPVAQPVTQQIKPHGCEGNGEARKNRQPPGTIQRITRAGQQSPPFGRRGLRTQADETQPGTSQQAHPQPQTGHDNQRRGQVWQNVPQ